MAHTKLAQGSVNEAEEATRKADELDGGPRVPVAARSRHSAFRALFAIWREDGAAVRHWGGRILEMADSMPPFVWHVPGRVLVALGEKEAAARRLESDYNR